MESEEKKPVLDEQQKSSMEILSELFSSFDAEPPLIIKKEKGEDSKHKKSKKKHKHKEKKHKKKKKVKKELGSDNDNESDKIKKEPDVDIKKESPSYSPKASPKKDPDEKTDLTKKNKIVIKDLSTIFQSTIKEIQEKVAKSEDNDSETSSKHKSKHKKKKKRVRKENGESGELTSSDDDKDDIKKHKKSKRHKSSDSSKKHKRSRSKSSESHKRLKSDKYDEVRVFDRLGGHCNRDQRTYSRDRDRSRERRKRHSSRDRHRVISDDDKYNKLYGDDYEYKNRRDYEERDDKWFTRDRYRGHDDRDRDRRYRDRGKLRESNSSIDKKKLLEIARRNAINMMKSGSLPAALTLGPQAQEKVIAAIKAGGKTIEELTDFCKTLSKKEELGDLSSLSEKGNSSDSDNDKPFHHPFQIKDRPTSITMNIKNSVPLPTKTTQERTSELRMQFPVSSGQQHRKTEGEWVPVSPKKLESKASTTDTNGTVAVIATPATAAIVPAPPNAPPGPQAFPTAILEPSVDIGSIVSQRLTAMRRLQENPHDVQALSQMYKSNKEMQSWAQSKQQPGQFTGSTGAQILSQAELSSGFQAWAKKDQLTTAAPVSGGMGMHLLQKMGWKPGEGLGKEKTGALEPLLLQVKLDKKGLVATEEQKKKKPNKGGAQTVKTLQGKHPVSLLGEYASKRKLGAPEYILCFECGPDHKKNFLFKVILDGVEYQPNVASANKKDAKAAAATLCLQNIGLLPTTPAV